MGISKTDDKWILSKSDNKWTVSKDDNKWTLSMSKPNIPHKGGISYWRIGFEFEVQ